MTRRLLFAHFGVHPGFEIFTGASPRNFVAYLSTKNDQSDSKQT